MSEHQHLQIALPDQLLTPDMRGSAEWDAAGASAPCALDPAGFLHLLRRCSVNARDDEQTRWDPGQAEPFTVALFEPWRLPSSRLAGGFDGETVNPCDRLPRMGALMYENRRDFCDEGGNSRCVWISVLLLFDAGEQWSVLSASREEAELHLAEFAAMALHFECDDCRAVGDY